MRPCSQITKMPNDQVLNTDIDRASASTANSNNLRESVETAPVMNEGDGVNCTEPQIRAHVCDVLIDNDVTLKCETNINTREHMTMFDSSEVIVLQDRNELQYVNVLVMDDDVNQCDISGLVDSGTEVSVANSEAIKSLSPYTIGTISSLFGNGEPVLADLVRLYVRCDDRPSRTVSFRCAVADQTHQALYLAANVVNCLMTSSAVCNVISSTGDNRECGSDEKNGHATSNLVEKLLKTDHVPSSHSDLNSSNHISEAVSVSKSADVENLRTAQLTDESLHYCFSLARQGRGKLFVKDNLLYRFDKIVGQTVERLVLSNNSRMQAMELAHETYGAHTAAESTCKRLAYSFWWPTITRDVKNYIAIRDRCVRRSRITVYDRTPFRSIERLSRAFQHWWCDIAGPLFPNQRLTIITVLWLVIIIRDGLWLLLYVR